MKREVGVGVVGLGLMGRVHVEAYAAARRAGDACRLVAASDRSQERLTGRTQAGGNLQSGGEALLFDPAVVATGIDPDVVFGHPQVELVSICTPTHTHVELALRALARGKHVLLEKPIALDPLEIERLDSAARSADRLCIPAMCMRHWPGWAELKDMVADRRHGALRAIRFTRLGARPNWGGGFYDDPARTGGALCDLHVHDVDMVHWLFGPPDSVRSVGTIDHVSTQYIYAGGPRLVVAEGGWLPGGAVPFRMGFVAEFEQATLEYDLRRTPPLELTRGGKVEVLDLGPGTGYEGEVRAALAAVRGEMKQATTLAEAAAVMRTVRAEGSQLI